MAASPSADPLRLPLEGAPEPRLALERLRVLGHAVLLESCGGGGRTILAAGPRAVFRWSDGRGVVEERDPAGGALVPARGGRPVPIRDPFAVLAGLLAHPPAGRAEPGTFTGGWIGYLGYEAADVLERLPPAPAAEPEELPTVWWGAYEWAVVWEPGAAEPRLEGGPLAGGASDDLPARMEMARRLLDGVGDDAAAGPAASGGGENRTAASPAGPLSSSLGREGYLAGVERIREYIRAGDIFQANLTHRLAASFGGTGIELYRELRGRSPSRYAAYLDTGEGEVVSISPESFLSLRGRRVETRPVKGTAPRHADPERDAALARGLEGSDKDRAENVMIVDLLRNDLSRVCEPGSVRVPRLLELESHPTVHHLVSTVEGELEPGTGPLDLLRAAFPGGSITGAPKIRAMEILRELEPVRRGVYTGALGLIEAGGDMELSIAIRTATLRGGRVSYGTGGGITLASDPEAEWRESLDKAAAFVQALEGDIP